MYRNILLPIWTDAAEIKPLGVAFKRCISTCGQTPFNFKQHFKLDLRWEATCTRATLVSIVQFKCRFRFEVANKHAVLRFSS